MKLKVCLFSLAISAKARADNKVAESILQTVEKYRPTMHLIAPNEIMKEPCGLYYDAKMRLYHIFYHKSNRQTIGGRLNWGHAVSKDLSQWQDARDALMPDTESDSLGVLCGQVLDSGIEGRPTIFYTGVSNLPLYKTELDSVRKHILAATSVDGGWTWTKTSKPLIDSYPNALKISEWRNPFVFSSAALDKAFGKKRKYMIVSGATSEGGPCLFLYTAPTHDYADWTYEGLLFQLNKLSSFTNVSGDFGERLEMSTYMEIEDEDGQAYQVLFLGVEGNAEHHCLWMFAELRPPSDSSMLCPTAVGYLDNSVFYGANVFKDPVSNQHIMFAALTEEDGRDKSPMDEVQSQVWSGVLTLPREVGIVKISMIFDPLGHLKYKGNWILKSHEFISCGGHLFPVSTITTLGIKPIPAMNSMRISSGEKASPFVFSDNGYAMLDSRGKTFELYAEISDFADDGKVGIRVRQNTVEEEYTDIIYDDSKQTLSIVREKSCHMKCRESSKAFNPATNTNSVFFKAYDIVQKGPEKCWRQRETLRMRIFVDVSVVEVFVNDRVALSARIYPCEAGNTASDRISIFSTGKATFNNVTVWPNMKHAWPDYRNVTE